MRTKLLLLIAYLIGLAGALTAQVKVTGNGNIETRVMDIIDYNSIKIDGFCDVSYTQSDADPFFEVTLDENLMPYLDVQIKDRVISIAIKGIKVEKVTKFIIKTNSKWLREARIAGGANFMIENALTGDELIIKGSNSSLIQIKQPVVVGKLDLHSGGSANIVVNDLQVDKLDCSMTGSGSITLKKGTAKEGIFNITSSGVINAFGVQNGDANCKVTGSGKMEVSLTGDLKANVLGSGHIYFKGGNTVQQKKLGKGKIERVD